MDLILHHYPLSPFSEKIRAMMGFSNISWASCLTSEAPPRGQLDLLTGGYSRIPVAQIGADIFCDTNIIADEIAALSKIKNLSLSHFKERDLDHLHWLEHKLFFACVNNAFSLSLLRRIAKEKGIVNLGLFLKDRIQMGAKASISMGSPRSASKHINSAIQQLEETLSKNEFIGGKKPNLLDFAAYHCFWFLTDVGQKQDLYKHVRPYEWYQKMKGFSDPADSTFMLYEALATARGASPRKLSKKYLKDSRIGSSITITPNDYRQIPVKGKLVGADAHRWIIRLEHDATGPIHLHFPTHAVDVTIRMDNEL